MKGLQESTAIDLFTGAGGLTTGLKSAGFSVVGAVELDPTSASSHHMNHPTVTLLTSNIQDVTGTKLLDATGIKHGTLDLLAGCPPCQGFSYLGCAHTSDPRNELIFDILRLIYSIWPKTILVENVPGFVRDRRFSKFRERLRHAGYISSFEILDAQHFSVPQRRRRLVLVASRVGKLPANLFEPSGEQRTVRDTIGGLARAGDSGDQLHDLPEWRSPAVMRQIMATPKNGGSRRDLPPEISDCAYHTDPNSFSDIYGRMSWDTVSPTITGGCHSPSKGRFLHPIDNRAITLREAALLQTFPLDYRFDLSRGKKHVEQQIGNAFPPQFAQPIAQRLRQFLINQG